jgi:uncharacterized protein YdeI (YjbR/CyaY-like superfamily)
MPKSLKSNKGPQTNAQIDAYILKAAPFAQPVLNHLRALVHHACPNVEEKIKWGMPHFDYHGKMMCWMAAFKAHCSFGFWKAALMEEKSLKPQSAKNGMGHLGRITSLQDLPSDKDLIRWIGKAMQLNDAGIVMQKEDLQKQPEALQLPDDFSKQLSKNKLALKNFQQFTLAAQKEYIDWIEGAKRTETREKRIALGIEWICEGKKRNWQYLNK